MKKSDALAWVSRAQLGKKVDLESQSSRPGEAGGRSMSYARARLWLGITTVGLLVVMATTAWVFSWPAGVLPTTSMPWTVELVAIVGFFLAWTVALLPFDVLGGYVIPHRFGRAEQSLAAWLSGWVRGVTIHGLLTALLLLLLLETWQSLGPWAVVVLAALLQVALVAGQEGLAKAVGNLKRTGGDSLGPGSALILEHRDPGFTGGIVGLPGRDRILLPARWSREFAPEGLEAERVRRRVTIDSGHRMFGLLAAIVWNTSCFGLALFAAGSTAPTVATLVNVVLVFCLLQFVGLLVLPSASRAASFAVDRAAVSAGVPIGHLEQLFRNADGLQDREPDRSAELESVFHPLPSVNRRLSALDGQGSGLPTPWNVARMALYLSWACGGPLARAVHCNVGRPELWVLLPY